MEVSSTNNKSCVKHRGAREKIWVLGSGIEA